MYKNAQPCRYNSCNLVLSKYFSQKSLSQSMYFLTEVGSEIIHYSLVPYLLPSWSQKPLLQSRVLTEHEPIHQVSQAIRYLVVTMLDWVIGFWSGGVLVDSLHQLSCVSTSTSVRTATEKFYNIWRKDWVSRIYGKQLCSAHPSSLNHLLNITLGHWRQMSKS